MTLHRKRRLRELVARKPFNGSQRAFGDRVGLTEGRVSQLMDDRHSFGERSAGNIAKELGLDERYFEFGFTEAESEFIPVRRADVKFSNGAGKVVYHMDDKPPLSFRADFLRKLGIAQGKAVVVDAEGISNAPKIMDGAVVLVDCADQHINGEFFAFRDGDELLIKRLSIIEGVGVLATSENPDWKPKTKVYTDPDSFEIIGRCRWVGAEL